MPKLTVNVHLFLNEHTEPTAYQNLKSLHDMGLHITATSPKPLPSRFYELVDVFLHDGENQLLNGHYEPREPVYYFTRHQGFTMNFHRVENQVHGLAVLRSMVKACELAVMYGMDWVLRIEFDDILSPCAVHKLIETTHALEEDLLIFRNDYGKRRDLSVHTMLYRPDAFLRVFKTIKDEESWRTWIAANCDYSNPILEELMLLMLEKSGEKVQYLDGAAMQSFLPGSVFNLHQSPTGLVSGCLADILTSDRGLHFGAWAVNPPGGTVRFVETSTDGRVEETYYEFAAGHWAHKQVTEGTVLAQIYVGTEMAASLDLTKKDPFIGSSIVFHQ